MSKFITFNYAGNNDCGYFTDQINKFLATHKILNVTRQHSTEKIETLFKAQSSLYIGYVIEYEDTPQNTVEQNGHIAQQTNAADGPTAHA